MTNVFYFDQVNSIGGIETFFYQLGKKYGKDYDITLLYREGDANQLRRLSQYIRVKKFRPGERIRCKRAFCCFQSNILDHIDADEYYQILHGDYTAMRVYPKDHPKIQGRISVSGVVRDSYKNAKGIDSIVSYNPFTPEKPRKVLNLVSATRLTAEKGWNRMLSLAEQLDKAGVPFTWTVYTDNPNRDPGNPSISLKPPRLNVLDFIANADYYVQLSDCEGYCYSVVEALSVGTPVIVTDIPVVHEIGVLNGKNGWILPLSMQNVPIDDIYNGLKKFKYEPLEDKWSELLVKGEPSEEDHLSKNAWVRCRKVYYDMEFGRLMDYGEEWECDIKRAYHLESLNLVDVIEC
jgi:glycosyltransferase involved in cell wall biosynthesis